MEKTLNNFEIGECGIVTNIKDEGTIRRRLFDMGITPGAEILLKKKAPLGDPIEVNIRGYELTLRKVEAELVTLKMIIVKDKAATKEKKSFFSFFKKKKKEDKE